MISQIVGSAATVINRIGLPDAYAFARSILTKSQALVLEYHRVSRRTDNWSQETISPEAFQRHIRHFYRNYDLLPLDELVQYVRTRRRLGKPALAITFDDGYMDSYTCAYPILAKYSVPTTIFLASGHVGTDKLFWWNKVGYVVGRTAAKRLELDEAGTYAVKLDSNRRQVASKIVKRLASLAEDRKNSLIEKLVSDCKVEIPDDVGRGLLLSWDDVREMSEKGIDFGAHSVTHPVLTNMSLDRAAWEIRQSKEDIERRLGRKVKFFSYPMGYFNAGIVRIVQASGFEAALTEHPSWIGRETNIYVLDRMSAPEEFDKLKVVMSGVLGDVRRILCRGPSVSKYVRR